MSASGLSPLRVPSSAALAFLGFLATLPACGGPGVNEPGSGQVLLRYEPAIGGRIRYHTVLRSVPADIPGRTVSATSTVSVTGEPSPGVYDVRVSFDDVRVAGERGSTVTVPGPNAVTERRGTQNDLRGEASVEGAEVASTLAGFLAEELVFSPGVIGIGDTWELPPILRPLPFGGVATIARTARLTGVEGGVASIEIAGEVRGQEHRHGAARVAVDGNLAETARVRVADGLLIERDVTSEVRMRSLLEDGTEVGTLTQRERAHTQRTVGAAPDSEAHDWRPDRGDSSCTARLDAMRRRFDQAPRGVDLAMLASLQIAWPIIADAREVDEAGPVLIGIDEETILGALAGATLDRAMVAYVLAPDRVSDEVLLGWLSDVPAMIELRRLVHRPVDPPSPPQTAPVAQLARTLRSDAEHRAERWTEAAEPLVVVCRTAAQAIEGIDELPPAERARTTRTAIHEALSRCGCDATDVSRLEHVLDLRFGGPNVGWQSLRR